MYHLKDHQIDFIRNDISARGVTMESLQHDLTDHICCMIEQQLDANGDFRQFYDAHIKTFYKEDLSEIENETISLITNKNYYAMKKIMITSGIISAIILTGGIILKFLHAQGAGMLLVLGISSFSLVFLPLLFIMKLREKTDNQQKVLTGVSAFAGMLLSMGILFKLMHWPGANIMGISSIGILVLIYIPMYLFAGMKNPETKINVIVTSILLIAGSGLFLSLARSPRGSVDECMSNTEYFYKNNMLFEIEHQQAIKSNQPHSTLTAAGDNIIGICEEIKSYVIMKETGHNVLDKNFKEQQVFIRDTYSEVYFSETDPAYSKVLELEKLLQNYNKLGSTVPGFHSVTDHDLVGGNGNERVNDVLNNLVQLELFVLENSKLSS